jgi:hypothetical protein
MAMQSLTTTSTNLGTTTLNIQNTDVYNVNVTNQTTNQVTSATTGAGGGAGTGTGGSQVNSQVVTLIKKNGTTIYTSAAGDRGATLNAISCTAGDVITVVTSSSLAQDQQLNAIQTTIALSEGPL